MAYQIGDGQTELWRISSFDDAQSDLTRSIYEMQWQLNDAIREAISRAFDEEFGDIADLLSEVSSYGQ